MIKFSKEKVLLLHIIMLQICPDAVLLEALV